MAEILDENADELTALAGRLPDDLTKIIIEHPTELPDLVREAGKLTTSNFDKLGNRFGESSIKPLEAYGKLGG